jgi:hypothetical protein
VNSQFLVADLAGNSNFDGLSSKGNFGESRGADDLFFDASDLKVGDRLEGEDTGTSRGKIEEVGNYLNISVKEFGIGKVGLTVMFDGDGLSTLNGGESLLIVFQRDGELWNTSV